MFSFAPVGPGQQKNPPSWLLAKRQKLSFAEKQRRRAERQQQKIEAPPQSSPIKINDQKAIQEASSVDSNSEEDSPTEMERAKTIIDSQRKSVNTLTHIRQCVEALQKTDMKQSFASGASYMVVDDFLNDDGIINELMNEAATMQQEDRMELDLQHGVGSGEYFCNIQGGQEQYVHCPRSVEFVVSVTKHLPSMLDDDIDSSASQGVLRTFSRKARMASVTLLTGKEQDVETPERPFQLVVPDPDQDVRRFTLLYYPLEQEWDEEFGGGVSVQNEGEPTFVPAKRDRLVLLKSDECLHRIEPWKGSEGVEMASCIELHLAKQATKLK